MTYLSICSGIEAANVAWKPLGFTPLGFSEIEKFPCAVLQAHYPDVKNYGDVTQYEKWTGIEAVAIISSTFYSRGMELEIHIAKNLDMPVERVEYWINLKGDKNGF